MPDTAALRLEVHASRRAGWLAVAARSVTALALLGCLAALSREPTLLRGAAALAAAAALAWTWRPQRGPDLSQVRVDPDGRIRARIADVDEAATVQFCSAGLLCLRAAGRLVAIWPDSLTAADWRRLLVCCRWPRGGSSTGGRPPVTVRTK